MGLWINLDDLLHDTHLGDTGFEESNLVPTEVKSLITVKYKSCMKKPPTRSVFSSGFSTEKILAYKPAKGSLETWTG